MPYIKIFSFIALLSISSAGVASNPKNPCSTSYVSHVYKVFDAIFICAQKGVPATKINHAVNVAAEWLDNDDNGYADEKKVIHALQKQPTVLTLTEKGIGILPSSIMMLKGYKIQDLYAYETAPKGNQRDASQEEIHHLIINAGWGVAYPDIFSDQNTSIIYKIYKDAEQQGYYKYDDPTCDSSCKSTEFHYLAMAAYLDSQADLFSDEMRIKKRSTLKQKIPSFVNVIESPQYNYPKYKWPTGIYTHTKNIQKIR